MTFSQWIDADDNAGLVEIASGMAWGAIKLHHQNRDNSPRHTPSEIVGLAEDAGYEMRDEALTDRTDAVARAVLRRAGYKVTFGAIGEDAILAAA